VGFSLPRFHQPAPNRQMHPTCVIFVNWNGNLVRQCGKKEKRKREKKKKKTPHT
jgi:hypothetical protein